MDASTTFMVYTFAVALCILHCQVASSLHYEVYNTTQRRSIVVDGRTSPFKYNHDSSIAYFQGFSGFFPKYLNILSIPSGKWIVLWNANTVPKEGAPGQVNLMSVANDTAYEWSAPVPAFSDASRAENIIPCSKEDACTQWQPNLIVVKKQLWAIWCQEGNSSAYYGAYFSYLSNIDEKWTSKRLMWKAPNGSLDYHVWIDGFAFSIFPTQDPIQTLSTGRILAPATLTQVQNKSIKIDTVLITNDYGATWTFSNGTSLPGIENTNAQWEPTVWDGAGKQTFLLARNNVNMKNPPGDPNSVPSWGKVVGANSMDMGSTWSNLTFIKGIESVTSRAHIWGQPYEGRQLMVLNDFWDSLVSHTFGSLHWNPMYGRRNVALFFTRNTLINATMDAFAFLPGISLTMWNEPTVAYPQMWIANVNGADNLAMSYSQGSAYRSIKVVLLENGLPSENQSFIYPRGNFGSLRSQPELVSDPESVFLEFYGGQSMWTNRNFSNASTSSGILDEDGWSLLISGEVRVDDEGSCLFDSRSANSGFLFGFGLRSHEYMAPFIHVGGNDTFPPTLSVPTGVWMNMSLRVQKQNRTGVIQQANMCTIDFEINGQHETVQASCMPEGFQLSSNKARIGAPLSLGSSVTNFTGAVKSLRVSAEKGMTERLVLSLTPSHWNDSFIQPEPLFDSVRKVTVNDVAFMRVCGRGSFTFDIDRNTQARDTVQIGFIVNLTSTSRKTLATMGDGQSPVTLEVENASVTIGGENCKMLHVQQRHTPDLMYNCTLTLTPGGVMASVQADNGNTFVCSHTYKQSPQANWVFIGKGYDSVNSTKDCFDIQLQSFWSRVI
eukprot:m.240020 g.240020  ORF g.240020 m.240020 type:complete len:834 (-) comp16074_c0_seq11:143-2644(-)